MSTRLLGTLGMLGSPMLLLGALLYGFGQDNQGAATFNLLFLGGWICNVLGLRTLRATGTGVPGKAILIVQLIGLALAAVFEVMHIVDSNSNPDSLLFQLTDGAWPLSIIFMIVVGIAALRTHMLRGWLRFTPLVCGLALPFFFVLNAVAGRSVGVIVFPIYLTIAWMLLGYTVRMADQRMINGLPAHAS